MTVAQCDRGTSRAELPEQDRDDSTEEPRWACPDIRSSPTRQAAPRSQSKPRNSASRWVRLTLRVADFPLHLCSSFLTFPVEPVVSQLDKLAPLRSAGTRDCWMRSDGGGDWAASSSVVLDGRKLPALLYRHLLGRSVTDRLWKMQVCHVFSHRINKADFNLVIINQFLIEI